MKFIVHAPHYMAGRAVNEAARAWWRGDLKENSLVGIVSGQHCFSIKRNKASVSVWHFLRPEGAIDPDKWEAS